MKMVPGRVDTTRDVHFNRFLNDRHAFLLSAIFGESACMEIKSAGSDPLLLERETERSEKTDLIFPYKSRLQIPLMRRNRSMGRQTRPSSPQAVFIETLFGLSFLSSVRTVTDNP